MLDALRGYWGFFLCSVSSRREEGRGLFVNVWCFGDKSRPTGWGVGETRRCVAASVFLSSVPPLYVALGALVGPSDLFLVARLPFVPPHFR